VFASIVHSSSVIFGLLAALLEGVDSDMNNVEGIHHRHRPWKLAEPVNFSVYGG